MLPGAPLLRFLPLLQAFCGPSEPQVTWFDQGHDRVTRFYSHARLALAEGLRALMESGGHRSAVLFIPAYFCNEALDVIRGMPVEIVFYPVRDDLSPDWNRVREPSGQAKTLKVFLLVHYFGFLNEVTDAVAFCREREMVLVEDGAHMLRPRKGVTEAEFSIFSPRKFLPVPSGGVLVIRQRLVPFLRQSSGLVSARGQVSWLAVKLLQKILVSLGIPWRALRRLRARANPPAAVAAANARGMGLCSRFAFKMLATSQSSIECIAQTRRDNYARLAERLAGIPGVHPLFQPVSGEGCPYLFPLVVDRGAASFLPLCEACGIPATQWPVLPPEVLGSVEEQDRSIWMRDHVLLLPLHQDISREDIDFMAKVISGGVA